MAAEGPDLAIARAIVRYRKESRTTWTTALIGSENIFRQAVKSNLFESDKRFGTFFGQPPKIQIRSPEARRRRERRAHEQDSPEKRNRFIDWDPASESLKPLTIKNVCTV